MPQIVTKTEIDASIKTCFDLARDVRFYYKSLKKDSEIPVSGKISGLVEKGDYITWQTNHLNFMQHLTLKVSELQSPFLFVDVMVKGEFKSYKHEHIFEESNGKTIMIDKFQFESSYGFLGKLVDYILLKKYYKGVLQSRNQILKIKAEESRSGEFLRL